jgi:uncharacterized protein Usg
LLGKSFRLQLTALGILVAYVDYTMGHKPYLDQSYLKPQEEELAEKCRITVPELAISR